MWTIRKAFFLAFTLAPVLAIPVWGQEHKSGPLRADLKTGGGSLQRASVDHNGVCQPLSTMNRQSGILMIGHSIS